MNIPDRNSESLVTNFWAQKYLNSLMQIRIRNLFDPGSGIKTFGDIPPGSTTLPELSKKTKNNSLDTLHYLQVQIPLLLILRLSPG